ncbi:MAG: hypothetical protein ACI8XO_002883 [Verrucomicrobiales bacterium]|jgi:hypothetical protein
MAEPSTETTRKLVAVGVYLACTGIFSILFLLLYALRSQVWIPLGPVWMVLSVICGLLCLGMTVALGAAFFVSLPEARGAYDEFIEEDPSRRDLGDAELRKQFDEWESARNA